MDNLPERLQQLVDRIERSDPDLVAELRRRFAMLDGVPGAEAALAAPQGMEDAARVEARESIVLPTLRPTLEVRNNKGVVVDSDDVESRKWGERLSERRAVLNRAVRAVGRIELERHFDLEYAGTGVLVDDDVVATNYHVARDFARNLNGKLVFRRNLGNQEIGARIDFMEEAGHTQDETFQIVEILHLQENQDPDLALLRVEKVEVAPVRGEATGLPYPVELSMDAADDQMIVVIGYPGRDTTIPDQAEVTRLFGTTLEKKRMSPGQIIKADGDLLTHDCSTLAGSSGSPLVDLDTGKVVGLHLEGEYATENAAVPARRIAELLEIVRRRRAEAAAPEIRTAAATAASTEASTEAPAYPRRSRKPGGKGRRRKDPVG
jgi:endonuclease G, mitochondrial